MSGGHIQISDQQPERVDRPKHIGGPLSSNLDLQLSALYEHLEDILSNSTDRNEIEDHTEPFRELLKQTSQYDEWAKRPNLDTICETGFNAGHSALRFLAQSGAALYEFDSGEHSYAKAAADFLVSKFPKRFNLIWGDSKHSLPEFASQHPDVQCDLIIIDGGHDYPTAMADLRNFAKMASADHVLTINDTPCTQDYCAGPARAWQELVKQGCVAEAKSIDMGRLGGFKTGHYRPCLLWPQIASQGYLLLEVEAVRRSGRSSLGGSIAH
jgi:hypothetical protein